MSSTPRWMIGMPLHRRGCRVKCIGKIQLSQKPLGLEELQSLLHEVYTSWLCDPETEGEPCLLTPFADGLHLVYGNAKRIWQPLRTLALWAAVRYVERQVEVECDKKTVEPTEPVLLKGFVPLDKTICEVRSLLSCMITFKPAEIVTKTRSHPPLFIAVARPQGQKKILFCHVFVCITSWQAVWITRQLQTALVELVSQQNQHSAIHTFNNEEQNHDKHTTDGISCSNNINCQNDKVNSKTEESISLPQIKNLYLRHQRHNSYPPIAADLVPSKYACQILNNKKFHTQPENIKMETKIAQPKPKQVTFQSHCEETEPSVEDTVYLPRNHNIDDSIPYQIPIHKRKRDSTIHTIHRGEFTLKSRNVKCVDGADYEVDDINCGSDSDSESANDADTESLAEQDDIILSLQSLVLHGDTTYDQGTTQERVVNDIGKLKKEAEIGAAFSNLNIDTAKTIPSLE